MKRLFSLGFLGQSGGEEQRPAERSWHGVLKNGARRCALLVRRRGGVEFREAHAAGDGRSRTMFSRVAELRWCDRGGEFICAAKFEMAERFGTSAGVASRRRD